MSIDYKQLQAMVKEAMFTGGGMNHPSAPVGVPHRMPGAYSDEKEQDRGDPKANKLYEKALIARAATEDLVEALDDVVFDDAYEYAFKASSNLRRALNSIEGSGAHPMPDQRVVAPAASQQKYADSTGYLPPTYSGGGIEEQEGGDALKGFGSKQLSRSAQAQAKKQSGQAIGSGVELQGVDPKERAMLQHIDRILTDAADKVDLSVYKPWLKTMFATLIKKIEAGDSSDETQ